MLARQPTLSFSTVAHTFWIRLMSMTGLFCCGVGFIILRPFILYRLSGCSNINIVLIEEDPDKSSMKEAENISFYR